MGLADKQAEHIAKLRAQVAEHVREPVREVAVFSRSGSVGMIAMSQVSGLGGMLADHVGKKASGGLPRNVLLVATDDAICVYEYKVGMGGKLKLRDELRRWPRATTTVTTEDGRLSGSLVITPAGEEPVRLDAIRGFGSGSGSWNEGFVQLVTG